MEHKIKSFMNYSEEISDYAFKSLLERTGRQVKEKEVYIQKSENDEICRIILSADRLFVSVAEEYEKVLSEYLKSISVYEKMRSSSFYTEILRILRLENSSFLLEPSEELLHEITYNVTHTLEFICTPESFLPYPCDDVVNIDRGDDRFILENNFSDTMFCILQNEQIASTCFYRLNTGIFSNTCAMDVFTYPKYRKHGYGKMTASAATFDVIKNNKYALWVSQVENEPSIRIAQELGYIFLGGEIRIIK